jgi:hypothetical protein
MVHATYRRLRTYDGRLCYVSESPVRSLIEQVAEISVENKVDVVIAARVAETPMVAVASTTAPIVPSPHESVSCPTEAAGPVELLRPAQVADIPDATSTATRPGCTLRAPAGNSSVDECITDEEDNVETHDNEIPVTSMTEDVVIFPPYPSEWAGDLVKKAWTGRTYASAVPYRLRNQPHSRLIYRRIAQDTNDNNTIIEDSYAMLHTEKQFGRELCAEPRRFESTRFYCERPQYFAHELTKTAMAVTGVQVNRRNKDTRDLGIRRWLADAGCGYDLVRTSMVAELGGQSLIRLRGPKYLQTANYYVPTPRNHHARTSAG